MYDRVQKGSLYTVCIAKLIVDLFTGNTVSRELPYLYFRNWNTKE